MSLMRLHSGHLDRVLLTLSWQTVLGYDGKDLRVIVSIVWSVPR